MKSKLKTGTKQKQECNEMETGEYIPTTIGIKFLYAESHFLPSALPDQQAADTELLDCLY